MHEHFTVYKIEIPNGKNRDSADDEMFFVRYSGSGAIRICDWEGQEVTGLPYKPPKDMASFLRKVADEIEKL